MKLSSINFIGGERIPAMLDIRNNDQTGGWGWFIRNWGKNEGVRRNEGLNAWVGSGKDRKRDWKVTDLMGTWKPQLSL